MISFQQKILPMISEEQPDFLKCKVCQKEFPRFDQRGFRNAGFTAHQNRCVEREYLLSHPIVDQQSSPRQRFLLPAPPASASSSTSNRRVMALRGESSSPIIQQQQQQQHLIPQYPLQLAFEDPQSLAGTNFHQQPTQTAGFHYVPENVGSYGEGTTLIGQENESLIQHHAPVMPVSIYEMLFPITHCDYCEPEYGLHQPTCLFLAEFLRQSVNCCQLYV
ncbi:unnamed protein product [Mucor hiemalis]